MVVPFTEMRKTERGIESGEVLGTQEFNFSSYKVGVTCATSRWRCQVNIGYTSQGLRREADTLKWEEVWNSTTRKSRASWKQVGKVASLSPFLYMLSISKDIPFSYCDRLCRVKRRLKGPSHTCGTDHIHLYYSYIWTCLITPISPWWE